MYLLLSCFITNNRNSCTNRYDRLEVFKYMLRSYSPIDFEYVYLYIEFDEEYKYYESEFRIFVNRLFNNKVHLVFKRLLEQHEWDPVMKLLSESGEDKIVWFTQNDDHIFIDFNLDILNEGIKLLEKDTSQYKSLYPTHWPEAIRGSVKLNNWKRVGNYINYKVTLVEGIHIYNLNFLKFLFLEYKWPHQPKYGIIDNLHFYQKSFNFGDYPENYPVEPYDNMLSMYVPLRELCRHFDGYYNSSINNKDMPEFPALHLPEELNVFKFTEEELIKRFYVTLHPGCPAQSANRYRTPEEWEEIMLDLYKPVTITK